MEELSLLKQRNQDLQATYRQVLRATENVQYLSRNTLISVLQEQPAPRFYLTPYQASLYILRAYRQGNTARRKQAMIADLVKNYERLRHLYPEASKTVLYELVVEQPAKSFYMSEHRMKEIVFGYSGRC